MPCPDRLAECNKCVPNIAPKSTGMGRYVESCCACGVRARHRWTAYGAVSAFEPRGINVDAWSSDVNGSTPIAEGCERVVDPIRGAGASSTRGTIRIHERGNRNDRIIICCRN